MEALEDMPAMNTAAMAVRLGAEAMVGQATIEQIDVLEAMLEIAVPRLDAVMGHGAVASALMGQRSPGPARYHAEEVMRLLGESQPVAWPVVWALHQTSEVLEHVFEHQSTLSRLWTQVAARIPMARPWQVYWQSRSRSGSRARKLAHQAWKLAGEQPLIRGYAARRCVELLPEQSPEAQQYAADLQRLEAMRRRQIP
jgi:hypothetical protein